jgi:hypothetical protein
MLPIAKKMLLQIAERGIGQPTDIHATISEAF